MKKIMAVLVLVLGGMILTGCSKSSVVVGASVSRTDQHQHTNKLINESSPYLLQHAHNPVNWYPWGEEALEKARKENKPIFLSIGYSACHWCHVMERESFEDEETAEILNRDFISIKVDREEHPEVDEIYMTAVQMLTGRGGWPLSVFLTPAAKPFYGGTYFPSEDRYGMPSFKKVLSNIIEMWHEQREDVQTNSEKIADILKKRGKLQIPAGTASGDGKELLKRAAEELEYTFDPEWGGFGRGPKFPPSGKIALLLRQYRRSGDKGLLKMATVTLDKMAYGGMYDQLGGGFHRYSVDRLWLVPHFEKMLYDNALLSQIYLEAYQVTKKPLYGRIVKETLDYVLRDMTDESGGFHSSEDADSEGEEGKFYVWRRDEIVKLLGKADGEFLRGYYGVTDVGNFEGENILNLPKPPSEFAAENGLAEAALESRVRVLKERLMAERGKRVRPKKDDKVLASWNGMMISSFARAYRILGDERFRDAAVGAGRFVLSSMMIKDGKLCRVYRKGKTKLPGTLDDYANMVGAFVDLYEATFDVEWITAADGLAKRMVALFADPDGQGFYFTSDEHKHLIARSKSYWDSSVPSGNSVAVLSLLRLAKLTGNRDYYDLAQGALKESSLLMGSQLGAISRMLIAVDFDLPGAKEIVFVGNRGAEDTSALLSVLWSVFMPNKVVVFMDPRDNAVDEWKALPLLEGRVMVGSRATVYVCEDYSCKKPLTDPVEFGMLVNGTD